MRFTHGLFLTGMALLGARPAGAHPESALEQAALDAWIAEAPGDAEPYLRRAELREKHREWAAAESDLQRAAKFAPDSPRVLNALGRVYLGANRPRDALSQLEHALALHPREAEALVLRARVFSQLGQIAAAYADYSTAIEVLAEPSPGLFLERAALPIASLTALRGLDEGLARVGPAVPLLEQALALELRLGRTDQALARLDTLAASSERPELCLKRRGDILVLARRGAEARAAYTAALAAIAALPPWLRASPDTQQLALELKRLVQPTS